jgi:hypothetical protein
MNKTEKRTKIATAILLIIGVAICGLIVYSNISPDLLRPL